MKKLSFVLALLTVTVLIGCKPPVAVEKSPITIGKPIVYKNLTIFPIISDKIRDKDQYMTLDEALRKNLVEISEVGSGSESSASNRFSNNLVLVGNGNFEEPEINSPESPNSSNQRHRPGTTWEEATNDEFTLPRAPEPKDQEETPQADFDEIIELIQNTVEPSQWQNSSSNDNYNNVTVNNASADVNSVIVNNKSDKPLYLMPGEIIYGGKQDRAVQEQIVIAPHSGPVRITVNCVEHGRWQGRDHEKVVAMLLEAQKGIRGESVAKPQSITVEALAEQANQGKFIASPGLLNKKGRLALQKDKDQSKVWQSVAATNAGNGVLSESNNYVANYTEKAVVEKLDPYLAAIQSRILKQRNVVGVIVAINGKFDQVEIFQSTPLFKKLWPKLLKNYALDAVSSFPSDKNKSEFAKLTCPAADLYLADMLNTEGTTSVTANSSVATLQNENGRCVTFNAICPTAGIDARTATFSTNLSLVISQTQTVHPDIAGRVQEIMLTGDGRNAHGSVFALQNDNGEEPRILGSQTIQISADGNNRFANVNGIGGRGAGRRSGANAPKRSESNPVSKSVLKLFGKGQIQFSGFSK